MGALGRLVVEIELGLAGFQKGSKEAVEVSEKTMRQIEKRAAQTEKEMIRLGENIGKGIGVAATAAAAALALTINRLDEINIAAERTGIGAERFQELSYAFKLGDASAEDLSKGLKTLAVNASENDPIFKQLGINITGANGALKTSDELLLDLADKFSGYNDGAEKTAIAVKLLGKSGEALIPTLNGGREGVEAMAKELRDLGGPASNDAIRASAALKDNLDKLLTSGGSLLAEFFTPAIKQINSLSDSMVSAAKNGGILRGVLAALNSFLQGGTPAERIQKNELELKDREAKYELNKTPNVVQGFLERNVLGYKPGREVDLKLEREAIAQLRSAIAYDRNQLEQSQRALYDFSYKPDVGPKKPDAPRLSDGKKTADPKETLSEYEKALAKIVKAETEALNELSNGQKLAQDILATFTDRTKKYTDAEKISLTLKLEEAIAIETVNRFKKEELAAREDVRKVIEAATEAAYNELKTTTESNQALREQVEEIGLDEQALRRLRYQRELNTLALKIDTEQSKLSGTQSLAETSLIERNIQALRERRDLLTNQRERTESNEFAVELKRQSDDAAEAYKRNFESFSDSFADALIRGGRRGLAEFFQRELLESTVRPIVKSLTESITKPIFESLYGGQNGSGSLLRSILGLFGGRGGLDSSNVADGQFVYAGSYHTGGTIGDGRSAPAYPASVFAGAQRYHSGGLVGGEVPIIAQRGERVLTRAQQEGMGGITINQNNDLRGASDPAMIQAMLERNKKQTIAEIRDMKRRGVAV